MEGEVGMVRPGQWRRRADRRAEARHRCIARQHEMIAIVDRPPKLRIVIGAAPPAGLGGGIGDRDLDPRLPQHDGRREPGQPGPDNRHAREAQRVRPSRATVHNNSALDTLTRCRGGAQPTFPVRASTLA